jgi:hypothetical protein
MVCLQCLADILFITFVGGIGSARTHRGPESIQNAFECEFLHLGPKWGFLLEEKIGKSDRESVLNLFGPFSPPPVSVKPHIFSPLLNSEFWMRINENPISQTKGLFFADMKLKLQLDLGRVPGT